MNIGTPVQFVRNCVSDTQSFLIGEKGVTVDFENTMRAGMKGIWCLIEFDKEKFAVPYWCLIVELRRT